MDSSIQYLAVLVPLAVIILLAIFFYRLFSKSAAKDKKYLEDVKNLDELKKRAEFRAAKIISVQPFQASMYAPGMRTVSVRLEIEDSPGKFSMHSVQWMVDDYFSSSFQPGDNIQVKIYEEYIFPSGDGAKLLP
ncbi:MAG: hypothetical protein IT281_08670 [Ignavibacteria bacterium]|nr:hypothetical protein [Ignavibacteria bacterium]MCC7159597.1 hypothetical protein [Ignavibacteria bacterium]